MSEVKKCEHGSEITLQLFETLDFNEEGIGRHKCVICAYSKSQRTFFR